MQTYSIFIKPDKTLVVKRLRLGFKVLTRSKRGTRWQIVRENTDDKLGKVWQLALHLKARTMKEAKHFIAAKEHDILNGKFTKDII